MVYLLHFAHKEVMAVILWAQVVMSWVEDDSLSDGESPADEMGTERGAPTILELVHLRMYAFTQ